MLKPCMRLFHDPLVGDMHFAMLGGQIDHQDPSERLRRTVDVVFEVGDVEAGGDGLLRDRDLDLDLVT